MNLTWLDEKEKVRDSRYKIRFREVESITCLDGKEKVRDFRYKIRFRGDESNLVRWEGEGERFESLDIRLGSSGDVE